jgi:GT2 family glycosyltransferase
VVADNASTDGSAELLRERAAAEPALTLIEMGRNAGYAAAVNAAFAALPGRDVMLLNPDVELPGPEPVRALAAFLEAHARVAVAGPRLVYEDGSTQPSARRFQSLAALLGTMPRIGGLFERSHARYEEPSRASSAIVVDWVIGAAMMIRREAYDELGGWDQRYFLYIEDTDFCRRAQRAGWEVAYVPEVTLMHRYPRASSRPTSTLASSRARRLHYAGLARLFASEPRLLLGRGRVENRRPL